MTSNLRIRKPSSILAFGALVAWTLLRPAGADAPFETFFAEAETIPEQLLRETLGVLTLELTERVEGQEIPVPREIRVFTEGDGLFTEGDGLFTEGDGRFEAAGVLEQEAVSTPSGGEYAGTVWRRFPVTDHRDGFVEIVPDFTRSERIWLRLGDLFTDPSESETELVWFRGEASEAVVGIDLFYLVGEQTFFESPSTDSPSTTLTPASPAISPHGVYDAMSFLLVEQRDGFGRVERSDGLDQPTVPLGWIRLRDEKGRLQVWPTLAYGC